jgi:NAD(P)-dependent dehydrogenase (short-subunit alcohol dehydrogenase family)
VPDLSGKVAIVTGAGRGIGRSHALALAGAGATVVVNDLGGGMAGEGSDPGPAEQVVEEIRAAGGEASTNGENVADFTGAGRLVQQAIDEHGRLDILVNNAGILRDRMLVNMSEDEWDSVIAVHLKGHFAPTQHAAAYWREQSKAGEEVRGRVVNTSSPSGVFGNVGQANYGAAKAGIVGFTLIAAQELGRYGVTVNAVAPAGATRMTAGLYERSGKEPPPEENPALNAPLVAFLASERAGHVNGQILGRTEYAYTLFQHPKQIAWMWKDGGWSASEVADKFDATLGQHVQPVGMVMPKSMEK